MRRGRDPQLFNFAFVDILATTIGVLIFILIAATLQNSGLIQQEVHEDSEVPPVGVPKVPVPDRKTSETPLHIDCRKGELIVLGSDFSQKGIERRAYTEEQIAESGPLWDLLCHVRDGKGKATVIVLWIRPDGTDLANKMINLCQRGNIPIGWEPALKDWVL